ncbi:glycosyltransferase [Acinetobacter johnsonii]|uniref:glycosyltransferase family 2 protein n=1 Tax=Acinetobacter johnsonii TaxID=40214 RepID=UPI002FDA79DE|nr:glycosyltransferase [Acinetobacter johnsonii]
MSSLEQPLVSVVIPCYNHENFVQDCIQSVINQTYYNIELIIIDDGSKDSSVEKIQEMLLKCQHRFTRFEFRSRPNKGLSSTLNEALEWCSGDYFSVIASDDLILEDKIEKQLNFIVKQSKDIVGVFGGAYFFNENDEVIEKRIEKQLITLEFDDMFLHNYELIAPTQFLKTQVLKDVGGFKNGMIIEDWYIWLKMLKNGKFAVLPYILAKYRMHNSNTIKNLEKMHAGRLEVLSHFEDEILYKKAWKNVILINAIEKLKNKEKRNIYVLFNLIFKLKFSIFSGILWRVSLKMRKLNIFKI